MGLDPERANKQWEQNTFLEATGPRRPAAQRRMAVPAVAGVKSLSPDPVQSFLRARAVKVTLKREGGADGVRRERRPIDPGFARGRARLNVLLHREGPLAAGAGCG
jgi:hypothetical protein